MLIAIATNDRINIAKRTGRAKEFAFFTIKDSKIIDVRYEKNNHEHHDHDEDHEPNHRQVQGRGRGQGRGLGHGRGHGHHHHEEHHHDHEHGEHSHDEVIEQLKDVDIFLVRAVGKHMRSDLEKGKIPFKVVTKEDNIVKLVENYLKELN
jgi:predicted Fe-Mo cluster-binding NifX family protein